MPTEADTCRKFVVPKPQASGWETESHSNFEQRAITDGRIVPLLSRTQAIVRHLTDYTAEKGRSLCANPEELRARWTDLGQRAEVIEVLQDRGIDFQTLALQAEKPDADPVDLLCHLAFNAPMLTRRQRAVRVMREKTGFFEQFGPEARMILVEFVEKYAVDGELQFTLPDMLKLPPISTHGSISEIVSSFESKDKPRHSIACLESFLYAS